MARVSNAALVLVAALASARASQVSSVWRHMGSSSMEDSSSNSFVRPLRFHHRLRVCNAFPFSEALEVSRGESERLTGRLPMKYKECRDFSGDLKVGDKLDFKIGDASTGTFSVTDLPSNDAVLLLVVHRHDTIGTSVAFDSHVFANLKSAQVAVIDAYKGAAKSVPRIADDVAPADCNVTRAEELRYNSLVAVSPGIYQVALTGSKGETEARSRFVALDHESYTILRTGAESAEGQSFPQELVVYPRSDEALLLQSGAAWAGPWGLPLLAALVAGLP